MSTHKESTLVLDKDESQATPGSAAKLIREVKYKTRERVSSEDKIRIVLEGFRKEIPTSDLRRRENISTAIYYSWLKDFMEAGKSRLKGDGDGRQLEFLINDNYFSPLINRSVFSFPFNA